MADHKRVFIGVSPLIPHLAYSMVVLDGGLHLLDKSEGGLEEILSSIDANDETIVGLNFPRQPNQGAVKAIHAKPRGRGRPPIFHEMRLCESILHRLGMNVYATPGEPDQCPLWMRQGFAFYDRLEEAGFSPYPAEGSSRCHFETQVEAVFRSLVGKPLLNQHTLEGRMQRQLLLYEHGLRIADPMDFFEEITRHRLSQGSLPLQKLYLLSELDAMAAAYMSWYSADSSHQISQVGDPLEGYLLLPYWKELETQHPLEVQQMTIF